MVAGSSIRKVNVLLEQRQHARGVGADGVAHARVEAVVHVRQHQIQIGLGPPDALDLAIHSSCMRRASPARKSRNSRAAMPRPCRGAEQLASDRTRRCLRNRARTSSFMGVKRDGLPMPSQRFEIQFRQIHAVPIEAADQALDSRRDRAEAVAIGQVHQLAPVELGILEDRGLLAPFRMIGPELLADVRQLEPGVDQDAFAMAGFDQLRR